MPLSAIPPVSKLPLANPDVLHAGIVQPFRSYEEYRATPGIEIATRFAEACNMHSLRRLDAMLAPRVEYVSDWIGVRFRGRRSVRSWFKGRLCWRKDGQRYHAQIVVLPTGDAGVLVEILPQRDSALISFKGEAGLASRIRVTPRYDRRELRLTGYFPPEA